MTRTPCFLAAILVFAGCASQTNLAESVRVAVAARHAGRTVELRQSCYYGDLYDENEKWLLSPYPFSETYHIVDTKGAPIHPTGQRGILPAGTRFVVMRVEFPDLFAMNTRMLTTPRYNPWVYLRPADPGPGIPSERPNFILLLPMDLDTEPAVEAALAEVLSNDGETTAWLKERAPAIQVGIKHKQAVPGMSEPELIAALGKPIHWFADSRNDQPARVAWYPGQEVWLLRDQVVDTQPARLLNPAPNPAPAGPATTTTPPPSENTAGAAKPGASPP